MLTFDTFDIRLVFNLISFIVSTSICSYKVISLHEVIEYTESVRDLLISILTAYLP